MPKLHNYDEMLEYVNRLGFAGHGNIISRQKNICDVANAICEASGIIGKWNEGVIVNVKFNRPDAEYMTVWNGSFTITTHDSIIIIKHSLLTDKWFQFTRIDR